MIGTSRNASRVADRDGVTFLDLDVASDESVTAAVQRVIERHGRLDVPVNNAGIGSSGAAEETSVAQDQSVLDINGLGVIRKTKAVLPHMRAQGRGRIINVSSILGFIPQPFTAVYAASTHAVEGYSESLDHGVREHGVRALLVEPAVTKTGFEAARNSMQPDTPLQVSAEQRHHADDAMTAAIKNGDDPATVARAMVAAASAPNPSCATPPAQGPTNQHATPHRTLPRVRQPDPQIQPAGRLTLAPQPRHPLNRFRGSVYRGRRAGAKVEG